MMLGPVIVDRMIDSYVTPQAVAAVNHTNKADGAPSETANAANIFDTSIESARHIRWDQLKYAFFSGGPLSFLVEIVPDHDPPFQNPTGFRFQWDGNWKLSRIILSSEAIDSLSAAVNNPHDFRPAVASNPAANPITPQQTLSTSEKPAPPLTVALVSKGFKASNIQAGNFEEDITIQITVTNMLDNDIRAFDGVLTFTDVLDNEILSTKMRSTTRSRPDR